MKPHYSGAQNPSEPRLLKDNFTSHPCEDLLQNFVYAKEIKPCGFQILPTFYGHQNEDLYVYLREFKKNQC